MTRPNGFSLFEVIIVLFLTGTVMGMVASLISKTFQTMRFMQEKGATIQSATLGGERLTSEMREMVELTTGGATDRVGFRKVNPQAIEAVGNDLTDFTTLPSAWRRDYTNTLTEGNQLVTVLYQPQPNNKLQRTVSSGAGSDSSNVSHSVHEFEVTHPYLGANNTFSVSLSIAEQRRIVTFTSVVVCPGLAI